MDILADLASHQGSHSWLRRKSIQIGAMPQCPLPPHWRNRPRSIADVHSGANFSEICSALHADAGGLLSLEQVAGFGLERWPGLHWNAWLYSLEYASMGRPPKWRASRLGFVTQTVIQNFCLALWFAHVSISICFFQSLHLQVGFCWQEPSFPDQGVAAS